MLSIRAKLLGKPIFPSAGVVEPVYDVPSGEPFPSVLYG